MTSQHRDVRRKIKVLRHAEQTGCVARTCCYFGNDLVDTAQPFAPIAAVRRDLAAPHGAPRPRISERWDSQRVPLRGT
jgi:hypothetical protein